MSIKDRIEEAEILWKQGRKEGAWILTLIAAAATSRKRYPKPVPDNKAFKLFIKSVAPTIVYGKPTPKDFDAQIILGDTPFEDILYEHLRCNLIHEAEISELVTFIESEIIDGNLTATFSVGKPNRFPDFWVLHLIKAIKEAPENISLFGAAT